MSNFDLRKYLAEGRLYTEAGGDMQSLPVDPIPGTPQVYSDIVNKIMDKLEGFYNTSEFKNIVDKIEQSLDDKTKIALVKAVQPKLSGGIENFIKSSIKQNVKSSMNEVDMGDIVETIVVGILNFIRGFAKVNILSLGMLPQLTAAAIEYMGGYPVLSTFVLLVGDSVAAAMIGVIATFIAASLIWALVDKITGEETNLVG
jgi:hypothetical protein